MRILPHTVRRRVKLLARESRRMRRQAKRNIKAVGMTMARHRKRERAITPRTVALLFLPYNPGPEPEGAQLATEFRFTVAKTRALQRYCRRGFGLAALSLASISLWFLVPFPWGMFAWAGAAYGVGKVEAWNKSCHSEQLAFIESTYRLGGFGSLDWDVSTAEELIGLNGLQPVNMGVIIGKSGPGKSQASGRGSRIPKRPFVRGPLITDDLSKISEAGKVSSKQLREWWAAKWPGVRK